MTFSQWLQNKKSQLLAFKSNYPISRTSTTPIGGDLKDNEVITVDGKDYVKVKVRLVTTLAPDITQRMERMETVIDEQEQALKIYMQKLAAAELLSSQQQSYIANLHHEFRVTKLSAKLETETIRKLADNAEEQIKEYKRQIDDLSKLCQRLKDKEQKTASQVKKSGNNNLAMALPAVIGLSDTLDKTIKQLALRPLIVIESAISDLTTTVNEIYAFHTELKKNLDEVKKTASNDPIKKVIELQNHIEELNGQIATLNEDIIRYQRTTSSLQNTIKEIKASNKLRKR